MKIPERFLLATQVIDPKPDASILEVGCGNGLLIETLANKISVGKITGCDKSASAIRTAAKRNSKLIHEEKVSLIKTDVMALNYEDKSFDAVVGFNVNLFLKPGTPALSVLHRLLKTNGKLFVFYQFPYEITEGAADAIAGTLKQANFSVITKALLPTKPTRTIAVVAMRK